MTLKPFLLSLFFTAFILLPKISKAQCPFTPTIIGTEPTCTAVVYKFHTEAGNTNYQWTVTGGMLLYGNNHDTVSVYFNTPGTQTLSVNYTKAGCTPTSATVRTVNLLAAPVAPITMSPNPNPDICAATQMTFSTTPSGPTISNYQWSFGIQSVPAQDIGIYRAGTISGSATSSSMLATWSGTSTRDQTIVSVKYLDTNGNGCYSFGMIAPYVAKQYSTNIVGTGIPVCMSSTGGPTTQQNFSVADADATCSNFVWSTDGGTIVGPPNTSSVYITWATPGIKHVNVSYQTTAVCGVVASPDFLVTVNNPVVTISVPVDPVCVNTPITYTVSGLSNQQWVVTSGTDLVNDYALISGGLTSSTLNLKWTNNPGVPVAITAYGVNSSGCFGLGSALVNVKGPGITGPFGVCNGTASTTFTVDNAISAPQWTINTSETLAPPTGITSTLTWNTTPGTRTITVSGTGTVGGCSVSPTSPLIRKVELYPLPATPSISSPGFASCTGSAATFFVPSPFPNPKPTYAWTITAPDLVSSPVGTDYIGNVTWGNQSGQRNVSVKAIDSHGCISIPATYSANINPTPVLSITGGNTICSNGSTTLTATGGAAPYTWKINGSTQSGTTSTFNANVGANYTVSSTVSSCTGTSAPFTVNLLTNPTASISPAGPITFCAGSPTTLTATTNFPSPTYQWKLNSSPITNATSATYAPTQSGSYTVTATSSSNCSATSAAVQVTVNPLPTVTITPSGSTAICPGATLVLTSGGATGSYVWKLNSTVISGATAATYTASAAGDYTVSGADANGCVGTSVIKTITLKPLPVTTITAGGPTTFCAGGSVVLSVSDGDTWQWKNSGSVISGATSSSYTATAAGNYTCFITKAGCTAETVTPKTVVVNSNPTVSISPAGPISICSGTSTTLTATAGLTSYQWQKDNVDISGATSQTYSATLQASYTVRVTNSTSCVATSTGVSVIVKPLPVTTIAAGGPTTLCTGGSVVLSVSDGDTWQWKNSGSVISGATSSSYTATAAGNYTCFITKAGCTAETVTPTTVVINSNPTVSISPVGPISICPGTSTTLTATAGLSSYQWQKDNVDISGATSQTYSASVAGSYTVRGTNASSCSVTSTSVSVTLKPMPNTAISAGSATSFCPGGSVVLSVSDGDTWQWKNSGSVISGATSSSYTATASGNYTCVVTKAGCTAETATPTTVTVKPLPGASISPSSASFCAGGSTTLTASTTGGASYQWYLNSGLIGGATSQTLTVSTAGSYAVITTLNGCSSASSAVNVTQTSTPAAPTITQTDICLTAHLAVSGTWSAYQWSTGATTQEITTTTTGTFSARVMNSSGCWSSYTSYTVSSISTYTFSMSRTIGPGCNSEFDITSMIGTPVSYLWSTGETTSSIIVHGKGTYSLTVTYVGGCTRQKFIDSGLPASCGGIARTAADPAPTVFDDDNDVTMLTVSPNPADGEINLQTPLSGYARKISLVNMQGVTMHTSQLEPLVTSARIPVHSFADGVYLLIVESHEKMERLKVLVQQKR